MSHDNSTTFIAHDKEIVNSDDYDEVTEDEYEYEDEDDAQNRVGFLLDHPDQIVQASSVDTTTNEKVMQMNVKLDTQNSAGNRRLVKDLSRVLNSHTPGVSVSLADDDALNLWKIELSEFDPDSDLYKDLKVLGRTSVELTMSFPKTYPFEPPFVQVSRPRFARNTGYVIDGALCMELLTKDGWNPINDMESVVVSIRSLLVEGGGRLEDAKSLDKETYQERLSDSSTTTTTMADSCRGYSEHEAKDAHKYLVDYHKEKGWSNYLARKG